MLNTVMHDLSLQYNDNFQKKNIGMQKKTALLSESILHYGINQYANDSNFVNVQSCP